MPRQMDQVPPPGPPILFHIRIATILSFLTFVDIGLVIYSLESITMEGVSAMVLFASEFMILLASIAGTTARYFVGWMDLRRARGREDAPSWEEKSMYLFYVDLAVGEFLFRSTQGYRVIHSGVERTMLIAWFEQTLSNS